MSTSYAASAIIGSSIDLRDFRIKFTKPKPSCPHPEREGHRFCPVCGVKVGQMEGFSAESELDNLVKALPPGYTYAPISEGSSKTALGLVVTTEYDGDFASIELASIDGVRSTLKTVLEPAGLWDDAAFGLHASLGWG